MSSSIATGGGSDAPVVLFSFVPGLEPHDLPSSAANFIRMIHTTSDGTLVKGEQLKQKVADLFPPHRMFSKDMMELSLLHKELVEWLNHWEAGIITDRSPRTVMALAAQLYQDDDRVLAIKVVDDYEHQGDSFSANMPVINAPKLLAPARDGHADNVRDRHENESHRAGTSWLPPVPALPSQDARRYVGSATNGRHDDSPSSGTEVLPSDGSGARRRALHDGNPSGVGRRTHLDDASGRGDGDSRSFRDAARRGGDAYGGASDGRVRGADSHLGADGAYNGVSGEQRYGRRLGMGRSSANDGSVPPVPVDRQAHNIGQRFKDMSAKFSGKADQLWDDYVLQYDLVTHGYRVDAVNKLAVLHNILAGEALRFFLDHVVGNATT